jgi:uncharacterized membrane protein YkvA (DUF1232 family)
MDIRLVLGLGAGFLLAWALLLLLLWLLRPRNVPLREALRIVPDILRLVRGLVADRSVPRGVRVALVVLVVWLISPIDLVPEFLPVIGPLDEVVVAVLVLRYVRRRLGEEELRRRWPGTDAGFALLTGILG